MRSLFLLLVSITFFYSCDKMELDDPIDQKDIDLQAWLEYHVLGVDLDLSYYASLKYEMLAIQDNPNVLFTVNEVQASSASFAGETLNINNNNIATLFFTSDKFDLVKDSISFWIDADSYRFPRIEPIKIDKNQSDVLSIGEDILWNEFSSAQNGQIVISLKRDNLLVSDSIRQTKSSRKIIFTDDDGQYTLKSDDLASFPSETPLIITLVRGDFNIDSNGFLIGTISLCHDFVVRE